MKRILLSLVAMAMVALAIGTSDGAQVPKTAVKPTTTGKKVITWVFASSSGTNPNIWGFNPYPRFQEMVERATDGRLSLDTKVDLFPATETINGVIGGRADIGFQRIPFVSGTFPLWDFGSLPFFFDNVYEYEKSLNDPRMVKIMEKTYREVGLVKLFESNGHPLDAIFSNKPISTVDQFKGLKIRTSGLLPTFTLKLLGASPLTMPILEISDALQRGTVDAVSTSPGYGLGAGMTDVTKYVNYWAVQSGYGGAVVVNLKSWNALPDDLKKILRNVGQEMQGQIFFATDCEYRVAVKGVEVAKLKVIVPDKAQIEKARELARPAINEWLKVAGPYGPEVLSIASQYASGAKIMVPKGPGGISK
jgi:TRAP-type C4-dicarboxylate transport system substrate-binding protein